MRSFVFRLVLPVAAAAFVVPAARATQFTITDDTYVDSTYSVSTKTGLTTNTQNINFDTYTTASGSSQTPSNQRAKVVSSNGSDEFPGNSRVRTLFTLPASFWTEYDTGNVHKAVVSFTMFNNSLNNTNDADTRSVELHPMTQSWGLQTATWRTYDGVHGWSGVDMSAASVDPGVGAGGGDYDAARSVLAIDATVGKNSRVQWDITSLLSNATAMAELRANGALLMETNEQLYENNRFYSMYSYNAGLSTAPMITTDVPEPAALAAIALGLIPALRRRRA